jgi:hypothetical protein
MTADESREEIWDNRRLCIDEACIGVLGPDGRCRECGKPGGDPIPHTATGAAANHEPAPPADPPAAVPSEAVPDDWDNRRLCSDESCIGVLGPDGRCKVCGKPASA